jgi:REP element-mobilizing transposase RayT
MPRSFSAVNLHIVFSTKDRHPFFVDLALRDEVHRYLGGISKTLGCQPLMIGGVSDHVHMLVGLGRSISQADYIKELKRSSSVWIKERDRRLSDFAWQGGYGAFSVDVTSIDRIRRYIANQEQHHKAVSFQDEFRAILQEHGLECEEKYIWE